MGVLSATGTQGSAVVRALLRRGPARYHVVAVTRDPSSAAAKELEAAGAELRVASLEDADALVRILADASCLYSLTSSAGSDFELELRMGRAIAAAVRACLLTLNHVVCPVRFRFGKGYNAILEWLRQTGVPLTELRQGFLMDHILTVQFDRKDPLGVTTRVTQHNVTEGLVRGIVPADVRVQYVCIEDVADAAVVAFDNGATWKGMTIFVAGDQLNGNEVAAVFSRVRKAPFHYAPLPNTWLRSMFVPQIGQMVEVARAAPDYTDRIMALRNKMPRLRTLERWLLERGLDTVPLPAAEPSSSSCAVV